MKSKWPYLYLSAAWAVGAVLNIADHRPLPVLIYNFAAAVIFLGLFAARAVCDRKGEKGDRIMKNILWIALAVVLLGMVVPVLLSLFL